MKKIIALAVSTFLLGSCNSNPEKTAATQDTAVHEQHDQVQHAEVIELNEGKKWIVNEEMKPFVLKGSELVDGYIKAEQSDPKTLASQLTEQNDKLIKSCTMKGISHENLHKWLKPHMELVNELETASDISQAKEVALQLQKSYQEYHNYFQ